MLDKKPKDSTTSSSFEGPTIGVASSSSSGAQTPTVAGARVPTRALGANKILGGRYEIIEMLGEGGMGTVYRARDNEVDRIIALKVIRPDLAANPEILRRFKQELVLARQITHKNVIRIYDLGEADGVKFITMEYVEGEDLRSILRRSGKLAPVDAVSIMQQVCRALDACHSEGVIHRDLKPSNVMRDKSGKVLVMDFGLAHDAQRVGLTQTGVVLGTLEYMSPEQAQGMELGPTADIYAAGLIFYELLTGKAAYEAQSGMASLMKRTQERAIAASTVEKTVPRTLSAIVSRCIEPKAGDRYQSVAELLADLEAYQPSGPTIATSIIRRPAKSWPLIYNYLAIACCVFLLVIAGFLAVKNRIWPT